jgi:transketolase
MLIYALLHLTGYDLSIEDIKQFRQLHSKTPGHPEYGYTPGVETTTGPLGQGITNAVGMALAEKILASEFNRPDFDIVNHYSYAFLGDGCLMEGISHEACSLAGTLGLGKLICFYDDNGISIDGRVEGWFSDDTPKRFEAYGWHVVSDVNGHDPAAIEAAIEEAKQTSKKPSMICCKTVMGMGSPNKAGTHEVHGAALGEAEIAASRPHIGWDHPPFEIPKEIYDVWDSRAKGKKIEAEWTHKLDEYTKKYPSEAAEFKRRIAGDLPTKWHEHAEKIINQVNEKAETIASRKASQNAIEGLAPVLPELVGGSADLAGSNLTLWSGSKGISNETGGNYIYYGVREFGMSAIMNGLSLHGGIIPYGATFLMFSEYARNALRMAALMKIRNLFVFTHDSIGLGEDGPTHQPVEQTATLRYIPNMDVWRPCDSVESTVAWARSIERKDGPSTLIFSRQNLPFQKRNAAVIKLIDKGGYILSEAEDGKPQAIIIATGSEIGLAMSAQRALTESGIKVRVVSMPCTSLFDRQDQAYKDSVLLNGVKRVAVEAGTADFWYKYVGLEGAVVGMTTFGESAPAGDLFKHFGFTVDNVVKTVKNTI